MVSVLVQRQQREAATRKERLLAARRTAAELSVRQARAYQSQKRQQELCVREDARAMWVQAQAREVATIDSVIARNAAAGDAARHAAGDFEAALQTEACAEDVAWQAERQLEAARHRLAVVYTRSIAHERTRPAREAEQRRTAVSAVEEACTARVVAAAKASPPRPALAVLSSLRAPAMATHTPHASIPVPQRARSPAAADAAADSRAWRMSDAAPHAHVTLHRAAPASSDAEETPAASARVEACAFAEAAADALEEGPAQHRTAQARAAERAAAALQLQHDRRQREAAEAQARRERLAAVRAHYREPRPVEERDVEEGGPTAAEGEGGEEAKTAQQEAGGDSGVREPHASERGVQLQAGHAQRGGTSAVSPSSRSGPRTHQRQPDHQQQPHRPVHRGAPPRLSSDQQAYLRSEAEFQAAFLDAPAVMLRLDEQQPREAPLSELLRPVKVADLLYAVAHGPAATPPPTELPSSGPAAARLGTRVLPSAPLHLRSLNALGPADGAAEEVGEEEVAEAEALAPAVGAHQVGTVSHSEGSGSAAVAHAPPASMHHTPPSSPTPSPMRDAAAAVVALSPLTPLPHSAGALGRASPILMEAPMRVATPTGPDVRTRSVSPPVAEEHSSAPLAAASAASSLQAHTPVQQHPEAQRSARVSALTSPATASSRSGAASQDTSRDSSSFTASSSSLPDDSVSTAASSRVPMPVMTAEQLKLALLRLRSRIRSTPV